MYLYRVVIVLDHIRIEKHNFWFKVNSKYSQIIYYYLSDFINIIFSMPLVILEDLKLGIIEFISQ